MWSLLWIPILDAEGEKIQIDLDPAPGGKVGQVIDTSECGYRVLARNFREFMAQYANDLVGGKYIFDESWSISRIKE
jgi:cell wall assembly regulator SMI1